MARAGLPGTCCGLLPRPSVPGGGNNCLNRISPNLCGAKRRRLCGRAAAVLPAWVNLTSFLAENCYMFSVTLGQGNRATGSPAAGKGVLCKPALGFFRQGER
jgi:hypothetical protein